MKIFWICICFLKTVIFADLNNSTQNSSTVVNASVVTAQSSAGVKLTSSLLISHNNDTTSNWYGSKKNQSDVFGCEWPSDFQTRYDFCYNKSFSQNDDLNRSYSFGYGILNDTIMNVLLNCKKETCDLTSEKSFLEYQVNFWWSNINGLVEFRKCLKKNTEAVARMCESDSQVSQIMSGMAGLYLNLLDVILDTYTETTKLNGTNICSFKIAEAVHITAATYISTLYYWKNSVLCWEVSQKTPCSSLCKKFATSLQCVDSSCPQRQNLPKFSIWSWYFTDKNSAQSLCKLSESDNKCNLEHVPVTPDNEQNTNVSKAQRLFEMVKEKYSQLKTRIESNLHVPFYAFTTIVMALIVVFIIIITLICLWYNGGLGRKRSAVVRYAKLLDNNGKNKYRVNVDETKSLTRDFDDVE